MFAGEILDTAVDDQPSLKTAALLADKRGPRIVITKVDDVFRAGSMFLSRRWSIISKFELDLQRFILARRVPLDASRLRLLSDREAVVLEYAAIGHANKFIAAELGVSVDTVATHIRRAARKLRVRSRVELVGLIWDLRRASNQTELPAPSSLTGLPGRGCVAAAEGEGCIRLTRFSHNDETYVILGYPVNGRKLGTELTIAECEVTASMLRGKSNRQIARERGTSEQTVACQVRVIFEKLLVNSRTELACKFAAHAEPALA